MYHNRLSAEACMRIQLCSVKSELLKWFAKMQNNATFVTKFFVLENMVIFNKSILFVNIIGLLFLH